MFSPDFTIIIPARGNPLGLWATINSCDIDLAATRSLCSANYVIVTNGEKLPVETKQVLEYLDKSGKLKAHIHSDDPLTPPVARQRGAAVADGDILCFFDNHCLPDRSFFARALGAFEKFHYDILHSATVFHTGEGTHYHYNLTLEYNFWGGTNHNPMFEHRPYRCAAAGHGGFLVRRAVWNALDGYGPESLFRGYGGEELVFDLKAWRYGFKVHIDPRLVHYHFPGARGYDRHYTDDYYINLLVSANVIGGEKWLHKVFHSFITKHHMRTVVARPWFDLMMEAYERSAEYAHVVDSNSTMTLDELLSWFRTHEVAM